MMGIYTTKNNNIISCFLAGRYKKLGRGRCGDWGSSNYIALPDSSGTGLRQVTRERCMQYCDEKPECTHVIWEEVEVARWCYISSGACTPTSYGTYTTYRRKRFPGICLCSAYIHRASPRKKERVVTAAERKLRQYLL